ncbi:MAG: PhoX family phosphatase [Myxococcales bacterium]|nr:PhoX family phosphatase [Myxococcales bacterium]
MNHKKHDLEESQAIAQADSRDANGEYFGNVMRERIARRSLLKGFGAATGAAMVPAIFSAKQAQAADHGARLTFSPILPNGLDAITVPAGYTHNVVVAWGDPLFPGVPGFDVNAQSPAVQAQQFGFNCDFIVQMPLPPWFTRPSRLRSWALGVQFRRLFTKPTRRALLWVNHEYTSGFEMFPGYTDAAPTADQVNIELAAHGGSLVTIENTAQGWVVDKTSPFNRRITGETPMAIDGPAAGSLLLQTSTDPTGRSVKGMLNNCGGGFTPWGTILTAEENFDQYFANRAGASADKQALYARLAAPSGASERKWERFHDRFDLGKEPNEYAKFGYVVEIDPYDPTSTPVKHTALGRTKHEAASSTLSKAGNAVVYSGDDARFEYLYKFVSAGQFNPTDRDANMSLLSEGTLYVAKFNADGSGVWLPLVAGQGPLTAAAGFPTQAEVCVNTRKAADLMGATKMDRPEDVDVSPVTGKVYMACTNNSARNAVAADAGEVKANPRLGNRWGHVIEISEANADNGSQTFSWEILLLCGDPAIASQGSYFAGFDPSRVSKISCPDNLDFDQDGNLWIATDGMPNSPGFTGLNDGIFAVPVEGPDRGYVRQFLSSVPGAEVASLKHSTDDRTLFACIQHPGEGGGLPNTLSSWPDNTNTPPRPAVVAVRHLANRKIGS